MDKILDLDQDLFPPLLEWLLQYFLQFCGLVIAYTTFMLNTPTEY